MTIKVGGGGGGSIGEIVKRHKAQNLDSNHLPCDGKTYLWSAYTEYQTHCDSVPIGVEFSEIGRAALTTATTSVNGAESCYNTTHQDYAWPTATAGRVVVIQGADGSGAASNRDTLLTAGIVMCVSDPLSGYIMAASTATDATISHSNVNGFTTWNTKNINTDDANFAATAKVIGAHCSDGGRFYALGAVNSTSMDLAYSPVSDPSGTWVAWASGMPALTGTTGIGSVAVDEGNAWLVSFQSNVVSESMNIWRATSLGGAFTKVLDISATGSSCFLINYDSTNNVFLALPYDANGGGFAMYASTDGGATWVAGDTFEPSVASQYFSGRPKIYDTTNQIWVAPLRNATHQGFTFIKIDSSGAPRLVTPYEYSDFNNSYTEGNNQGYPMAVDVNTRIIMNHGGQTTTREIVPATNFATQFYIPRLVGDGTIEGSQIGYSIKVK